MKLAASILILLVAFQGFPQSADPSLESARKKLEAKDFKAAKEALSKIIDSNPKNKVALSLRGQARMGLQDFYGAISDFTFALEVDSTYSEALNFRGESKIGLGDDYGAIEDLDKAIKYNSKYTDAYTNR
ncbi:MAG: hypothetical protein RIF34_01210, partial [Candidatus Kapaibacterium sp.]